MALNEIPPKPVAEVWHPEWITLPEIHFRRKLIRCFLRGLARALLFVLTKTTVRGMENLPRQGPALVTFNHLGDGDIVATLGLFPLCIDYMAKIDMPEDMPLIAKLAAAYGVIWVHRGRPDLRALRVALDGLAAGRIIGVAPEARYSLTGALEKGTEGTAFIALRSGVPIVPVALSGTENKNIYGNLKKGRRPRIRMVVGRPFYLSIREGEGKRDAIRRGTEEIMCALSRLLPSDYRGEYADCAEGENSEQQNLA